VQAHLLTLAASSIQWQIEICSAKVTQKREYMGFARNFGKFSLRLRQFGLREGEKRKEARILRLSRIRVNLLRLTDWLADLEDRTSAFPNAKSPLKCRMNF